MPQHAPFGPKGHGTAAATGFALGALSMAGLALALYGPAAGGPFGAYVALLAAFHQLEYICVAAYRPDTLSFDCAPPSPLHSPDFLRCSNCFIDAAAAVQLLSSTTVQHIP